MPAMAKPTKCPRCGRENDPSFAFCLDCGGSLRATPSPSSTTCASCGGALQPGFRFCGVCGTPAPAPPAPQGREAPKGTSPHVARPLPPADPPRPRFRLAARRSDGGPAAAFPLERDEVLCGRTEGEVRLADDPTVSPRHARFTQVAGVLHVEDLGSVNGTFVRLREPRRIQVGDELRVGRQLLRLEPLPRPAHADDRGVRAWGTRDAGCRFRLSQLLEGGGLGEVFPLRDGANEIGREAGEVTFPSDRYVSARHARIEVGPDGLTVADAGSANGTFVRIAGRTDLEPGDQLLVGAQLLCVEA
jgi:pSer/pThr/pTyr-binding forkhead associated (FHA) protein